MKDKAIFFTVYNRPLYLIDSLNGWKSVKNLSEYDIYFKIDPSDITEEVISIIDKFSESINLEVTKILNTEKEGCARNTWNGFNMLFDRYNFVILAEDDILPSNDLIDYFNFLENKYREDDEICSISANYEMNNYPDDKVSRISAFRGQIWGTWKDYWNKYMRDTWDFDYSSGVDNGPCGWDWNLTLRVLPNNNLKSIVPHSSRSQHIGIDGLHSNRDIFKDTQLSSFKIERSWETLVEV